MKSLKEMVQEAVKELGKAPEPQPLTSTEAMTTLLEDVMEERMEREPVDNVRAIIVPIFKKDF